MSEESITLPISSQNERSELALEEQRRARGLGLALLVAGLLVMVVAAVDAAAYLQSRAWQMAAAAAVSLTTGAMLLLAFRSSRRGLYRRAVSVGVAALSLLLPSNLLLILGTDLVWAAGAVVLAAAVGALGYPRRRAILSLTAGLIGVGLYWAATRWIPWTRFDVDQSAYLLIVLATLIGLAGLVAVSSAVGSVRIVTIRTRLLVSFVGLTLLATAVIAAASLYSAYTSGRQRAEAQLELTTDLKVDRINSWINQLQNDLDTVLVGEETSRRALVLLETTDPSLHQLNYSVVRQRFLEVIEKYERFTEVFLLDRYGRVLASTDSGQEGVAYNNEVFFQRGRLGPYVQPPLFTPLPEHNLITVVQPVRDANGQPAGVLGARANLQVLEAIVSDRSRLGTTGEAYLVGRNHRMLTQPRPDVAPAILVLSEAADRVIETEEGGLALYANYADRPVIGVYRWLPRLQVAMLAEQEQAEAFRAATVTLAVNVGITLLSLLAAFVAATFITRSIANPLSRLAETAERIAAGDLELVAEVERTDETALLARTFNHMTGQLRGLIASLEERVAERTRDLERRSRYLEAAADVGSTATSMLDADQLIQQVVELIRSRFDLYYVGLFLLDPAGEWAVLQAGTGSAGQAMLARGHRIQAGTGMIGWSIARGRSRIALEAGADAVRLASSELPETRSEAAIPLRSRGRVLGALTVQDTQPDAFDQATIAVLQTMADQVAVALDNAQLFHASEEALEAQRRAYGELSRQAWADLLRTRTLPIIKSRDETSHPVGDIWGLETELAVREGKTIQGSAPPQPGDEEAPEQIHTVSVPVQIRGETVAVLNTYKAGDRGDWSQDEVALLEEIARQLEVALDSARLFEETQRFLARERLVRQITEKVRATSEIGAIARTAAEELGKALDIQHSFVALAPGGLPTDEEGRSGNGRQ